MALHTKISLQRDSGFNLEIDTNFPERGYTAIYGASGSGKTTLLRCIAGLEQPEPGNTISLNGWQWQKEDQHLPCHKREIGFVFQDAQLLPHLNVSGNLDYAVARRFSPDGPKPEQVVDWLALGSLLHKPVQELSAGQKQRVAIARALLSAPRLLLMDEPLASLDEHGKNQILLSLETLHRHLDIPVLYVSHDLNEVTRLADHLLVLEKGRVVAAGPTLELCSELQLDLSHEEHAAAILQGTVIKHDDNYQLSEINVDGQPLILTRVNLAIGESIRVRIPARDVSITLQQPQHTSILNIIACQIDAIETSDDARILIRLKTGSQYFLSRLTRKSAELLNLKSGDEVFAQIKSVALLNDCPVNNQIK